MKRWGYVIAVVGVLVLGSALAGVRHGAMMIEMAEQRAKSELEEQDRSKSDQLAVELFAEGLAVTAAAQIQAQLQAGQEVRPGLVVRSSGPLRLGGGETIRGQVVVESVEGESYRLKSEATCEVVEAWQNKRSTHSKQATFPVEITAEKIGDLSGR